MDTRDTKQIEEPASTEDGSSGQLLDTQVNEASLVRKIDWRIVPTLFLAYFLQFLDKVAINVSTADS